MPMAAAAAEAAAAAAASIEDGRPQRQQLLLMDRVDQYTVFVKNSIAFPFFGPQYRR